MILKSRQNFTTSEEFRDKFIETLTPGVIKRSDFIQWDTIFKKTEKYNLLFDFFRQLSAKTKDEYIKQIADALMSSDKASDIINASFELLGHTGKTYVSNEDYIDFRSFEKLEKDEKGMLYISTLLVGLGICNILNLEIDDYFVGVQVGLETHRRKNVGGTAFSFIIFKELSEMVERLNSRGNDIKLTKEEDIYFSDGKTSKTLDYCLHCKNQTLGIEINFYTASGSKPTEIKRSYGHINKELEEVGATLVWITDGIGYKDMKNSLKEARDIHKNTYNFNMMKESFESDVVDYFKLK
jgi:hypothetical protein